MSAELKTLLEAQNDIHGRMSRSVDNLRKMGVTNISADAIRARITILDNLWSKVEAQHELIRTALKDKYQESEYARSDFIDSAESTYVSQRSTLLGYADKLKSERTSALKSEQSQESALKTSLPRIKLHTFSGTYEEWPAFRDLFSSIIGDNASVSNVEKLHYLRSSLQGPAEKLIRSLPVIGSNFERAWALLSRHYENKRELIRSNFAAFTAVPKMKAETSEELSRVLNATMTAVNAQESIDRPIASHGMDLLNHLVVELFDAQTRLEWESSSRDSVEPPSHAALMDFISKRILTLNAAKPKSVAKSGETSRSAKSHFVRNTSDSAKCAVCKGKHSLMQCTEFRAKPASERKGVVEANRLCYNCLGNHLMAKCQSVKTCFTCKLRHHTLLHDAYTQPDEASSLSTTRLTPDRKAILLATARVTITDHVGRSHDVRALIDQGSEVSLMSESLAQRLRLPRIRSSMPVAGIGGASGATRGKLALNLSSGVTGATLPVLAYVLPRLSAYQGPIIRSQFTWPHIRGLPLADPQYLDRDPIDLLLGAEVYSAILQDGLRKGRKDEPIAQQTSLGWILSGGHRTTLQGGHTAHQCVIDRELNDLVQRFWEQEKEPSAPVAPTPEEEKCEELFTRSHRRTPSGRYVVRLPVVGSPPNFSETRKPAQRLLSAMERRCVQDAQFGDLYKAFMREYENLEHMEEVSPPPRDDTALCYLPHHGVLRSSSASTKLRVVFNGSQRTKSGTSLNAHLLVGANLLPALADVLLRWRWHRYVFLTDIEKMYRQILVDAKDRDLQRILWRHSTADKIREYRLKTVTYGLACAPFLAMRTLRQLADDEGARFPRGAVALRRDTYVDDIVTGASTLREVISLQRELRSLCTAGGFPLRKWAANNSDILVEVPREHWLTTSLPSWTQAEHATLGLHWNPSGDHFTYSIQNRHVTEFTKRCVLSETARLFDPLGWLTPVSMKAKILIQSAWLKKVEWDTPLPSADALPWRNLLSELPLLNQVKVSRWLTSDGPNTQIELHGFADASERGYAAVVYLRSTTLGHTALHLIAAKGKVAPVKPVSLPRLELCAATLLVNLATHIRTILGLFTAPVTLWSDSTVTLSWIQGHASRWKTYVANRVSHIQQQLPEAHWRHVPGRENPADCASRGILPSELNGHPLWWTGPAWLRQGESSWPRDSGDVTNAELPEQRTVGSTFNVVSREVTEPDLLRRFSTLHRLLRVTAWCRRWRPRTQPSTPQSTSTAPTLEPREIEAALIHWIHTAQALHYHSEVSALSRNRTLPTRSPLIGLCPFLDDNGVMRVGGRLKHAILSPDERHPMLVPPESWVAHLLVDSCHRRSLHGGVQLTLGLLRQRFWIVRGRVTVKRVIHQCTTCTRWRAATPQPLMGNLPQERVTPARPFQRTGVDYAGPIPIRASKGRGHRTHKGFIALFICLSSKAVHLEAASDYTADAFLAAFRRFVSRRGLCHEVFSDCGTNFVGASRELRELFRASTPNGRRIAHAAASDGIRWRFNPPAAPHFGGLWEAAVKSTKHHLRRVIGETTLTFEEMTTLLTQVEACLNSRPLQPLTDDPDDIAALTPGHFLIGAPLLAIPEPSLADEKDNALSRWQLVQKLRDHYWQRWSREYLQSLATRPKWTRSEAGPNVGDLCLVRSEVTPPTRWPLARITALHPGDDGVTRVVTVRTASSELVRPLAKIIFMPGANGASSSPRSDS